MANEPAEETTKIESSTTERRTKVEPKAENKPAVKSEKNAGTKPTEPAKPAARKPATRDKPEDAPDAKKVAESKAESAKPEKAPEDKQHDAPKDKEPEGDKVKTMADQEAEDRVKANDDPNPPKGSDENEDIMRGEEKMKANAALARKADALEEAGGDPAKVNELRYGAPAVRHTAIKTTAERDTDSNPTVRDSEAYAFIKQAEAEEIAKKENVPPEDLAAKGKAPKSKLSGVSDVA